MTVQYVPSGQLIDDSMFTPEPGASFPARTIEVLDNQPTDIALIGVRESGTPLWITGLDSKNSVIWKAPDGSTYGRWPMDSSAARDLAISGYMGAKAGGAAAITMDSDGAVTWVTPAS